MNRKDWEEQVFGSDMNPTARMVCIAIGSHGNWTTDKVVRPSKKRIAGMVGVSRDTAGDYIDALEEQGWLKSTGEIVNRVKVFELSVPQVASSCGMLSIKPRGQNLPQVASSCDNLDDSKLPQPTGQVASTPGNKLPQLTPQVASTCDTNLKNLEENLEEPIEAPASPVELEEDELDLEDVVDMEDLLPPTPPNTAEGGPELPTSANAPVGVEVEMKYYSLPKFEESLASHLRVMDRKLDETVILDARAKFTDEDWLPQITDAARREMAAVREAESEYYNRKEWDW
jgi:DNA-binding Lrp family transcriptional regulator